MKRINKKTGGIIGTAAALAVAAGIAVSNAGGTLPYTLTKANEYVEVMTVEVPDKYDLTELYLGDELVDLALAPDCTFEAAPIAFSKLENLSIKLYERGQYCATAQFENGKLIYK